MHEDGDDGEDETVSHVEDADDLTRDNNDAVTMNITATDLRYDNPDNTQPPEVNGKEECSKNVSNSAAQNVPENILNGVS